MCHNKKKKEHFGRGDGLFKEKRKEVQGGWREGNFGGREGKERKEMEVRLQPDADGLKRQEKECGLAPVGTGAMVGRQKRDLAQLSTCYVLMDTVTPHKIRVLPPRKLQPFRREGKIHNDLASYTGPKPFIQTKSYMEHQYYFKREKKMVVFWQSQRHPYTAPCPIPRQHLK